MRRIFNKYIIIILCFYAFWILGLPFIFSKTVPIVCQNISERTNYSLEIEKPKLRLSVLPVATLSSDKFKITEKESNNYTLIHNPKIRLRLFPLLSGRVHINEFQAGDIVVNTDLKKDMELDRNFFKKLKEVRIKCDEIKLDQFVISLWQKNIKTPILYTGKDVFYKKNGRFIKINLVSNVDINNSVSTA